VLLASGLAQRARAAVPWPRLPAAPRLKQQGWQRSWEKPQQYPGCGILIVQAVRCEQAVNARIHPGASTGAKHAVNVAIRNDTEHAMQPTRETNWIPGTVVPGHGVASGAGPDRRYPAGTIRLQQPHFLERGIDLSSYYPGTLNIDLAPLAPVPWKPLFDGVIRWFDDLEERFLLSPIELDAGGVRHAGLWYYPHPQTKPAHFQRSTVMELLLPWIDGIRNGDRVLVRL
jgi:hypothetical protein